MPELPWKLMRWQIIATQAEEAEQLKHLLAQSPRGWSLFYHIEKNVFFQLGYGTSPTLPAAHWRRSVPNQNDLPERVLSGLKHGDVRAIRVGDFRRLYRKLRERQIAGQDFARAFLLPERLLLWHASAGSERLLNFSLSGLSDKLREERILLEEMYFRGETRTANSWQHELNDFSGRVKKSLPEIPAVLYADNFSPGAALLQLLGWNHRCVLVCGQKSIHIRRWFLPPVRQVLVITNVAGPTLPALEHNLEFWGRGIPGVQWKHLYGKIDVARLSRIFETRRFDLIIYRGHAEVAGGKLWVSQSKFFLEHLPAPIYLHLACSDFAPPAELTHLPARWSLIPAYRLLDFEDSEFVKEVLPALVTGAKPQRFTDFLKNTPFVLARR